MSYSRAQVCRILQVRPGRLRYWERLGLLRPPYDFPALARARGLARLVRAGVSLTRLPPDTDWVGTLQREPLVRDRHGLRAALSGQGVFDFETPEVLTLAAPPSVDLHALGLRHFEEGRYEQARQSWVSLLEQRPRDPHAHYNLALACEELDQLEQACQHLETALELRPGYARAHYNLARLLERRRQPLRAWRHWRAFLRLRPEGPESEAVRFFLQRQE